MIAQDHSILLISQIGCLDVKSQTIKNDIE